MELFIEEFTKFVHLRIVGLSQPESHQTQLTLSLIFIFTEATIFYILMPTQIYAFKHLCRPAGFFRMLFKKDCGTYPITTTCIWGFQKSRYAGKFYSLFKTVLEHIPKVAECYWGRCS